jgi:hypothetical protein
MVWHNMGIPKSKTLGREPYYSEIGNTEESVKTEWLQKLENLGCSIALIG